ncbi:MAG: hypothetical protein Q9218_006556 [Villophora microphyllina]
MQMLAHHPIFPPSTASLSSPPISLCPYSTSNASLASLPMQLEVKELGPTIRGYTQSQHGALNVTGAQHMALVI